MAIDVTCECGREFGVTNDSVGRSVKCPECGSWVRVLAAVTSDELARTIKDLTNAPENQASEHRWLASGLSLAVTEHGWRLVASTRSFEHAIPWLIPGTANAFIVGFVIWQGLRQRLTAGAFWIAPLPLALFALLGCVAAMFLFGRIEFIVEGDQGTVFTGVGNLGRTQHFVWSDALEINDEHMTLRGGMECHEIVLYGARKIRTGKFLTKDQSSVLLQTLQRLQRPEQRDDGSGRFAKQSESLDGQAGDERHLRELPRAIKIICECGNKFSANEEFAGRTVTCPECLSELDLSQATIERALPGDEWDTEV